MSELWFLEFGVCMYVMYVCKARVLDLPMSKWCEKTIPDTYIVMLFGLCMWCIRVKTYPRVGGAKKPYPIHTLSCCLGCVCGV